MSQFSKSLTKIREVLYKGKSKGLRIDSVGVYITEVVKNNRKPEAAMVVIEKLVNEAYIKSPWTLCCMIIGGFLTTERWLAEAITKKARPTGLFYPGLLKLKTRLKIHVCEDTKSQHPELWKLFLKLQRFQKVLLLEFKVLLREWNKYLSQRGVRSQPWRQMVAIVVNKPKVCETLKVVEKPMVLTLSEFLQRYCPVNREFVCSGNWNS